MTSLALAAALLLQAEPAVTSPAATPTSSYQAREQGAGHVAPAPKPSDAGAVAPPASATTAGTTTSSAYGAREPGGHAGTPATPPAEKK